MKDHMVIMNFTDIYKEQEFWRDEEPAWAELTQLTGCSCYCDETSAEEEYLTSFSSVIPACFRRASFLRGMGGGGSGKASSFTGGDPHRPGSGSVRSGGSGSAKTGEISFPGETERGARAGNQALY